MVTKPYNLLLLVMVMIPMLALAEPASGVTGRAVLGINIANGQVSEGPVEGVAILGVTPGGAADEAGIVVNDVLVAIDNRSLTADSAREANRRLMRFMDDVVPGQLLRVTLLRGGDLISAELSAGELDPELVPSDFPFLRDLERFGREFEKDVIAPMQFHWRHQGTFTGMELVSVSPELGRYFGTEEGLLVIRAPDDEQIGLEDGDIIRRIGARKPSDPGHAMRILRSYEPGEELVIDILREKNPHEVRLTLPERPEQTGRIFPNWLTVPGAS